MEGISDLIDYNQLVVAALLILMNIMPVVGDACNSVITTSRP